MATPFGHANLRTRRFTSRCFRIAIEGLADGPRSGRPLTHGPKQRALLIAKACTRPPEIR
jgi:hypothetical protein